jgi:hypothetical protein
MGKASPIAVRQSWQNTPPRFGAKYSGSAEGRLDSSEARVATLQGDEAVVEEVEDAAVGLVAAREGSHAPDHAGGGLETGEVLANAVEAPQHLGLGHGVESAAVVGDEVHARERLEAGAEAGLGAPDALGDGRDQPGVAGVEVQDTVRLAVADRA